MSYPNLSYTCRCSIEFEGRTLEETAALFDGENHPVDLMQTGGQAATLTMNRGMLPAMPDSEMTFASPEKLSSCDEYELRRTHLTSDTDHSNGIQVI